MFGVVGALRKLRPKQVLPFLGTLAHIWFVIGILRLIRCNSNPLMKLLEIFGRKPAKHIVFWHAVVPHKGNLTGISVSLIPM